MPDLTVLITGATDGIGRRLATRFARPGNHLLLHGRDARRGADTVAEAESGSSQLRV
ncbi:SDR family NAD(P)-dependent oxidoreductase [Spiractinospora alimapuensis]|uniref:SDR family NAD(P)-dependent oxidoreductase n=1 Tax=Spiractinospora alimapuensis TaxID=2820884 RepID=UPI001F258E3F|nr:SDR family NAD(P)-dependent oxidoreductase [Spiractinospora alimapuensis]QVQ51483.1 SDR family NAD(P)-dependent oxidoreductase [Spiractinospora alimapuensis]